MVEQISFLSAILPIIAFILAKLHSFGVKARLKHNIKLVLGNGVESAEDIVFSLPVWAPIKDGDRSVRYNKPIRYEQGGSPEINHLHGPDLTYAQSDVESAIRISSVIAKELKKPVQIIPDSLPLEELHNKSYIFIGAPTVNSHASSLFSGKDPGRLTIVETEESADTLQSFYYLDQHDNKEYHTDEDYAYALVRRKSNEKFHCFYLFGQHESGTKAAAKYLIDNFYSLRYYPDDFEILLKVKKSLVFCDYDLALCPEITPPSLTNRALDRIFNARQIS